MPKTKTKTRKSKKATTTLNVVLVWDMSGSMGPLRMSALEGATNYITDLLKDENASKMRLSITAFDTIFERWYEDMPLGEIPVDALRNLYHPRGWTALNDAVADSIFTMDERLKGDRAEERALIVVLTDGLENSSKEYGGVEGTKALADLIKQREETGRWTFVYLGAGKPAEVAAVAASYNIPRGNTVSYAATPQGTAESFNHVRGATIAVAAAAPMASTRTVFADAGLKSVEEQEEED